MASELFKKQVQVAIQTNIGKEGLGVDDLFIDWFNKSRKHILVSGGKQGYLLAKNNYAYNSIGVSAVLTLYVSEWVPYIPVYDPVLLLERFKDIDVAMSKIVYLYDLKILGGLPEYEMVRFFSYLRYLLMNDVRCVMAIDCGFDKPELDLYFRNKKVSDLVLSTFGDSRYCKMLEV